MRICRQIFSYLLFGLLFIIQTEPLFAVENERLFTVVKVDISGIKTTDPEWVIDYLGLDLPAKLSKPQIDKMSKKLLTTAVFSRVETNLVPDPVSQEEYTLEIKVEEKWTLIPVVRGAYGGGTPLQVIGLYDTHVFGKLWTVGAETRKYGSSPAGYVAWAKAPRWLKGRHVIGFEYWQDRRRRDFFTEESRYYGYTDTHAAMLKSYVLFPLESFFVTPFFSQSWQLGATLQLRRESPNSFQYVDEGSHQLPPRNVTFFNRQSFENRAVLNLVYDSISVNNIEMEGRRLVFKEGPIFSEHNIHQYFETEGFFYFLRDARSGLNWNLALHYLIGGSSSDTLSNQFFLGGFDSVRGVPDSALYGSHVLASNVELRKILLRARYTWIQLASFVDYGTAEQRWSELFKNDISSAGLGVRFMIPQVYRLMFRIDYAWSLDNSKRQGINVGLNQLFEPYLPLSSGL